MCQNAPDPAGEANDAPPDPLIWLEMGHPPDILPPLGAAQSAPRFSRLWCSPLHLVGALPQYFSGMTPGLICSSKYRCELLEFFALFLQETEQMVPASVYFNEYAYAAAANQMPYDPVEAAPAESMQVTNTVV